MQGVDVSHYQGAIHWQQVRAAGVEFAILKATEGASSIDPMFSKNLAAARAADLIVGAYHFGRPSHGATGRAEAEHFMLSAHDASFHVLDIEDDGVKAGVQLSPWVLAWCARVEELTGRVPWIYSYAPYWREHGSSDAAFRRFPWWLADYKPPAASVTPWGAPTVWQYTSEGHMPGIGDRVDLDAYGGDRAAFLRLIGAGAAAPTPPLEPPTHFEGDAMTRTPVRVRTDDHGRGYADLPAVAAGRVVSIVLGGDEPSDGWGPYVGAPAYAVDKDGHARIVMPESPVIKGTVDLAVWVADD